ncbi:MAG: ATPase [Actinobacteria bacterium]|nr:ATPase [Actinomycetota bacterium]
MDFMTLIDKLENLVANGKHIPLTNSVIIDEQKIYALIDEMRGTIPDEVKQARWIIKERQEMLEEAEKEANKYISEAMTKAESLLSEREVVRLAEEKAKELIEAARAREREVRLGAEDYADEMLANLEVHLGKLLSAVQRGRDRLQGKTEPRV